MTKRNKTADTVRTAFTVETFAAALAAITADLIKVNGSAWEAQDAANAERLTSREYVAAYAMEAHTDGLKCGDLRSPVGAAICAVVDQIFPNKKESTRKKFAQLVRRCVNDGVEIDWNQNAARVAKKGQAESFHGILRGLIDKIKAADTKFPGVRDAAKAVAMLNDCIESQSAPKK